MEKQFLLSCESTVDLPYAYVNGRGISVLFYVYTVDGTEYLDDMGRSEEAFKQFYGFLAYGKMPSTSQLNVYKYLDYFDGLLRQGKDVLHIAFGSGLTPSVHNAFAAADQLREKYPDRKLIVIDSLCACTGYGLLVDDAADLRDQGKSMEEVRDWVMQNRGKVHHQFFSTDMKFFRRSGRVSGPAATVASVLNICPLMRLNNTGHIVAYDKVRGVKKTIQKTVEEIARHIQDGPNYSGKCFISHSNAPELARQVQEALEEAVPGLKGRITVGNIGTIIVSHCGPGTVATFFWGDERR